MRRRTLVANLRYLLALLSRFRVTFVLAAIMFLGAPSLFRAIYVGPNGERIRLGEAVHHVYFLMFGQPSLPYVDSLVVELMNLAIPPLGIAVVVDGIARFAYLFFARRTASREWIEVMTSVMEDHVVVCGAGRVGYRVAEQLLALGRDVVVVDKKEDAAFVSVLRDRKVPVLIDDIKSAGCLERIHLRRACAVVCATDDDLANLNVALDARRLNPDIRVVIRLFDDDLVAKVRDTFRAEALSTSAVAAPAMALAALDPRIVHSFQVAGRLMVVSPFVVGDALAGRTLGDVQQSFGAFVLSRTRGGAETFHPDAASVAQPGDVLTVQASYDDYRRLREHTGERRPPVARVA